MKRMAVGGILGLLLGVLPVTPGHADVAACAAEPYGAGQGGVEPTPRLGGFVEFGAVGECAGARIDTLTTQLWYSPTGLGFFPINDCPGPTLRVGDSFAETGPCAVSSIDTGFLGVSATVCWSGGCFTSPMIIVAAPVNYNIPIET